MSRSTRSQTVAGIRFQANLASVIHRLPNEVIARILIIGCPFPCHEQRGIDAAPLKHQVLVTSICKLWRQIGHHSPSLWTSVIVRPPHSKRHLIGCKKMLSDVLARSGTLELDISICAPPFDRSGWYGAPYYDLLTPYLSRAHTLDVESWSPDVALVPISRIPEFKKLRHFYAKAGPGSGPVILPLNARNSPLETFYYGMPGSLHVSSMPIAGLQIASPSFSSPDLQAKITVKLVEGHKLQKLVLDVLAWDLEDTISSSTLVYLDIHVQLLEQLSGSFVLGELPLLLHLRLSIRFWRHGGDVTSSPLPSLRSLNITIDGGQYLEDILQGSPQLVALQIRDEDALEAISLFRERWHRNDSDSGVAGESLRLIRVIIGLPVSPERLDELSSLALILHGRRDVQTEWYTEFGSLVVLDGIEATPLARGKREPSPPLSNCADKIISGDKV